MGRSTTCTSGSFLSVTGAPAASDSLRLVSAAFWVAAALVAFLLAYRATGSLVLAAAVHLLAFRALGFIGEETAHPQEACVLLLLALGRAFYIANRRLRMVMIGVLGGAIAATKINLGIFVLVALTVALTYAQPRGWRRNAACIAVSFGALALPGGADVGPPHGALGHLLLRADRVLAWLHPAHRVGPAVEEQLRLTRCGGGRRRVRRDRGGHLLLSANPGQHAQRPVPVARRDALPMESGMVAGTEYSLLGPHLGGWPALYLPGTYTKAGSPTGGWPWSSLRLGWP